MLSGSLGCSFCYGWIRRVLTLFPLLHQPCPSMSRSRRRKRSRNSLMVSFLSRLPLKLLRFDHRVHFCCNGLWVRSVSAAAPLSQQFFCFHGTEAGSCPCLGSSCQTASLAWLRWVWRDVRFAISERNQCDS